jgi:hypothetical protein
MTHDRKSKLKGKKANEKEALARRDFFVGLAKWSSAVIGGIAFGGVMSPSESQAYRGSWVNRRGGGGWANRRGGGGWANAVGGAWHNIGGTWANARGGGGRWVNRRGSGGRWVNRR